LTTLVWGQDRQIINSKNKNRILGKNFFFLISFLHGEKGNFEEYSLYLESTEFSFATLINYLTSKCRTYPRSTVCFWKIHSKIGTFSANCVNQFSFDYVGIIDCKITMFKVKKNVFSTSSNTWLANFESSWLKTFALHKVEVFDIMLGNWVENSSKK
jgi:hypothetical protein